MVRTKHVPLAPWMAACITGAIGFGLELLLLFLAALLLPEHLLGRGGETLSRVLLLTASVLAAWLACRRAPAGKLPAAGCCAGTMVVLLALLCVFTNTSSPFNMSMLLNFLCIIFGAFLGCTITMRRRRRVTRSRR